MTSIGSSPIGQKVKLVSILLRPGVNIEALSDAVDFVGAYVRQFDGESLLLSEVGMKYEGYIEKEQEMVEKIERLEAVRLSDDFDYRSLVALSMEAREKIECCKTAHHWAGESDQWSIPSDISILLVHEKLTNT